MATFADNAHATEILFPFATRPATQLDVLKSNPDSPTPTRTSGPGRETTEIRYSIGTVEAEQSPYAVPNQKTDNIATRRYSIFHMRRVCARVSIFIAKRTLAPYGRSEKAEELLSWTTVDIDNRGKSN